MRHLDCSSTVRRAWEGACRREKLPLPLRTGWSPERIHFMLWRDIFDLFTNVPFFLNFPLFDQLPGQMWSLVQQQLNTCGLPCVGGKVECDPHYPPCLPRPVPGQAWSPGRLCARCRLPGGSAMASYTFSSSSCSSPCVFSFYQMVGTSSVWKAGTSRMATYFEKGEKDVDYSSSRCRYICFCLKQGEFKHKQRFVMFEWESEIYIQAIYLYIVWMTQSLSVEEILWNVWSFYGHDK